MFLKTWGNSPFHMQDRHTDRLRYFSELSKTSKKYFIPYISQFININPNMEILEVGCGEGGNLLPFAVYGCNVTGIDISSNRINQANSFFHDSGLKYEFIAADIFKYDFNKKHYDIIICHDVFEHISKKQELLQFFEKHLSINGIVFLAFPAWQMPFGGHQQICKSKVLSFVPFIHLLPNVIYTSILNLFNESNACIKELLDIKSTHITIESFYSLNKSSNLNIKNSLFWLINPHYEEKFGLKPRKLWPIVSKIKYVRNYLTTSFWCILKYSLPSQVK